ncbi:MULTISPECIES: hypothetical protein [Streptomyces]|uniref:Uncharacterized protein n=2 Tax=Streptomyces rhizosphaericus TaxID=114699 RepID=A0ABP4C2Z7_9ACTN|nr:MULTISPECIES: hypothetical protein [Streptomyces]TMU94754.1 hypothetical protein FGK60_36850 [Streptomyces sp. DASNCL29]
MYEISESGLKVEIELGGDSPETVENADGWVELPNGEKWAATFLTYAEVGRILDRWSRTGEFLNGGYFVCSDLVMVRNPGAREMFNAVKDMVATGSHRGHLTRVDPE